MKTARFCPLLPLALGALVAGSLLGNSASAQAIQGEFLVAGSPDPTSDVGGGLFLVDAVNGSTTALTGVTGDLRRATTLVPHPTVPTRWFVGINGEVKGSPGAAALYQVDMAGGQVIRSVQLNTDSMLADVEIMTLQLVEDQLYFGTRTRVGSLSINGGTTKTLFTFSRNFNYPEFVSDGRYLYGNIYESGGLWNTGGGSINRIDLQNPTSAEFVLSVDQFPTNIRGVFLDSQGRLITLDKGNFGSPTLRMWDINSKQQIGKSLILPFMSLQTTLNAAIDTSDGTIVVSGQGLTFSDSRFALCTVQNFQVTQSMYSPVAHPLNSVGIRRAPGLIRRGNECATTLSPAAWTGAVGPANAGNANYALTLHAQPSSIAVLLLGAYNGLPSAVTLPGSQCDLGVSPILIFPVAVPSNGPVNFALPLPSSASGLALDTQWVLQDSGANSFGFVTTQVGAVHIR